MPVTGASQSKVSAVVKSRGKGPKRTGGVGTCCRRSVSMTSGMSISRERYWKVSSQSVE